MKSRTKKKNTSPTRGKKQKRISYQSSQKSKIGDLKGSDSTVGFPHFRRYLKSGHPALILSERKETDEYNFRKVTHSDRDGRHLNEKVEPNPDPADPKPMYIGKRVRHDKKRFFGDVLPWKWTKKE